MPPPPALDNYSPKRQGHSPHEATTSMTEDSVLPRMGKAYFFLPGQLGHMPLERKFHLTLLRKTRVHDTEAKTAVLLASFQRWEAHRGWSSFLIESAHVIKELPLQEELGGQPLGGSEGQLTSPAPVATGAQPARDREHMFGADLFSFVFIGLCAWDFWNAHIYGP